MNTGVEARDVVPGTATIGLCEPVDPLFEFGIALDTDGVIPAIGAVHIDGQHGTPFEITELGEHEERV